MGYTGQIAQITLGDLGLYSDAAPSKIPLGAVIKAANVDYGPGYIQKAPGSLRYNGTQALSSPIVGLIDYWPSIISQRMIAATADGKIYRDIGDRTFGAATPIATGLGPLTNACQFIIGGTETAGRFRKLFFFSNGLHQLQVLTADGTSFATVASPATDWVTPVYPKFGFVHRNRLWAFTGSQYYASNSGNHEDFTTSQSILTGSVGPGEGGECTGGFIYKGKMFIFKEGDYVYALNDSSTSTTDWYFYKFGEGLGMASVHAAIQAVDDMLIGNTMSAITSYSAVQAFGDVKSADILTAAFVSRFYHENTSPVGAPFMHALFYDEKKIAFFTARTKYRTNNDALITLDLLRQGSPRYGFWTKDSAECLALRKDVNNIKRPIYGSADGYVYLMDQEDRLVGGSAYTGEFKTPHYDFRHLDTTLAHKNKLFDFLGVTFQPEGNHNLSVDVYIDGAFSQTLAFNQTIASNYAGAFKLGSSPLGVEEEQTIWQPIKGSGRRISFRCYNSGGNENFKASMLSVGFRVAGENATRLT